MRAATNPGGQRALRLAQRPDALAIALLAATVAIWGSTPQVTAVAGQYAQPLTVTSLRAAPTSLVLLAVLPLLRFRLPRGVEEWLFTAVSGLLMVTVFLGGFTEGVLRAGPGPAVVLASTSPFWVATISWLRGGEPVGARTAAGLLVGFGGVILVFSSQLGASGHAGTVVSGLALSLLAAVAWAIGTLTVKELLTRHPRTDPLGLVTGQYLVGGAILLAISFAVEGSGGAHWSATNLWLAVGYTAVIGSALASVAYVTALRWISATRATTTGFLSPVVAVIIGLGLGDVPGPAAFVGMALTLAGVAIVNAPPRGARTAVTAATAVGDVAQ